MELIEILQALNACHGPSGSEGAVAGVLRTLAAPYVDSCTTDALGNLICHKKGSGPKVLFAAHMDSIGLMVTYIDEKGFLRFGPVGGLSAHEVLGTPVRFANGTRGVVALEGKVEPKDMKLEHLYLDIGARNEAEAKAMVQVGDIAVYDTHAFCSGGRIFSPYLDDRIACAVLLMAMERLKNTENDLYFVFTVQEEVGLRGARTAAYGVAPDYGIAVDVTDSDDIPSAPHACSSVAGKGGYAALLTDPDLLLDEPSLLLMDIGGWTVDLMRIDNARPVAETAHSLEFGMIRCIDAVREQVRRETGLSLTDAQIEQMLAGGPCALGDSVREIVRQQGRAYTERLFALVTEAGFDLRALPTVMLGGGAGIVQRHVGPKDGLCRAMFLPDDKVNAVGFERALAQLSGRVSEG